MRLSEKTHVYDVANRPWLLPFIADKATGRDRLFLRSIIRQAGAGDPTKRPSFADLVDAIDEFIRRPTNMEESPKERLYASPLIQSNERRKAAFWDYASVVVMGEGMPSPTYATTGAWPAMKARSCPRPRTSRCYGTRTGTGGTTTLPKRTSGTLGPSILSTAAFASTKIY